MSSLLFYTVIDDEIIYNAGITVSQLAASYLAGGERKTLTVAGESPKDVYDPEEIWRIETSGITLDFDILIESPHALYGPNGVACTGAELGVVLRWSVPMMKRMGFVEAVKSHEGSMDRYAFTLDIPPGSIDKNILLETVVYISRAAEDVAEDETHLINEAGVTVGTIDQTAVRVASRAMLFPIVELEEQGQPLWWLDLTALDDPAVQPFDESALRLYLNKAHPAYRTLNRQYQDELMVEILSTAYLLIFQKIEEFDSDLRQLINNIDLEPGSVSMVMHYFWESCDPPLRIAEPSRLERDIRTNIARMIGGKR